MATRRRGAPLTGSGESSASAPADLEAQRRKLLLGSAAVAALIGVYFLAAALVPRWWAQRIGDAVNGHLWVGSLLGLVIGAVCTFLPLVLLRYAAGRSRSKPARITAAVLAVLLAAPNLCTLAVVVGGGGGARAGRTVLDVKGPMFRGATLAGAIVGALAFAAVWWLLSSRRRGAAGGRRGRHG
ncbi:hypothetical protein ACFV98_30050 [Streptomyces violascens]|uniref:hypothetical protein n=1 Tax=Streptomyces violascens TaxID=67381 RepID=UPI00364B5C0A